MALAQQAHNNAGNVSQQQDIKVKAGRGSSAVYSPSETTINVDAPTYTSTQTAAPLRDMAQAANEQSKDVQTASQKKLALYAIAALILLGLWFYFKRK